MSTIAAIFSGVDMAIKTTKSISEAASSIKNSELKMQVAELLNTLAEQKTKMADIKMEIIDKDEEIHQLKLQRQDMMSNKKPKFQSGSYIFDEDDGKYCTRCFDVERKQVRVTKTKVPNTMRCPECKADFSTLTT